jgi:hypothetical protein
MKQILLFLFISFFLGVGLVKAQNPITLSHEGKTLGDTVTVWVDPDQETFVDYKMSITNNTGNGMNVLAARKIIKPLSKNQFTFCLGPICYGPSVDSCDVEKYLFVPAGGSSAEEEFKSSYSALDTTGSVIIGTAIVKYNVYNKDNFADSVNIVIKYWVSPQGIEEDIMKGGSISAIYPNPASNYISLDYQLTSKVNEAKIKVFNVLGSTIKEANMLKNAGKLKLDINDLESGIYFYSVFINGEIYTTKKFIVRK